MELCFCMLPPYLFFKRFLFLIMCMCICLYICFVFNYVYMFLMMCMCICIPMWYLCGCVHVRPEEGVRIHPMWPSQLVETGCHVAQAGFKLHVAQACLELVELRLCYHSWPSSEVFKDLSSSVLSYHLLLRTKQKV